MTSVEGASPGHACSTNQVRHDAVHGWVSPIGKQEGPASPCPGSRGGRPRTQGLLKTVTCRARDGQGQKGPQCSGLIPKWTLFASWLFSKPTVDLVLRGLGCVEWFGRGVKKRWRGLICILNQKFCPDYLEDWREDVFQFKMPYTIKRRKLLRDFRQLHYPLHPLAAPHPSLP
jgi:hypothetical protein